MPSWLKYMFIGGKLLQILVSSIPKALEDKKLTLDEATGLIKEICALFDWNLEISIPREFSETYVEVTSDISTLTSIENQIGHKIEPDQIIEG